MNILDIAIAKKLAGGGGGSGTDNYNDLSNLPKINDTTLSGNKSSSALGLQSEITSDSKLASDLVDDTNQDNKFVTSTEKNTWNGKQNAIDADHKLSSDLVDDANHTNKFVTSTEKNTWNAKQNAIDSDHKLSSDLVDDANKTNKFVTSTEKNTWNAKQNAIDSEHKLSSSLVSFTDAEAAALASGIDSSKVGQISTNQTNILYALGKTGHNLLEVTATSETVSGVVYTVNKNAITISSNGSNTTSTFVLNSGSPLFKASNNVFAIDKVMPAGATITVRYTDGSLVGFNSGNRNTNATLNNSKDVESIYLYIDANKTISDTIKVMVCTQDDWEVTHEITPYQGVPNYDLTRLQSEDRAALAEEIDSGAKNKWDFANVQTGSWHATVNKTDTSFTVTSTGIRAYFSMWQSLPAGHYVFSAKISNRSGSDYTGIAIRAGATDGTPLGSDITFSANGTISGEFTCTATTTVYFVCYACMDSFTGATTYTASDIMVATKAAFGVSPKFVPYRPPYDELMSKGKQLVAKGSTSFTITGTTYLVSIWVSSSNIIEYANYIMIKYSSAENVSLALLSKSSNADTYITITTSGNTVTVNTGDMWKIVTINKLC